MKKINNYIIFIYSLLILFLLLSLVIFLPNFRSLYYDFINPFFWIMLFFISKLFSKNDNVRKKYKYDYIQIVFISVMVYLIIYYLFGLVTGYNTLPYDRSFLGVIKNLWSYVFVLFFQEYIRQILINRSGKSKLLLIIITGIYATYSIINLSYAYIFSDFNTVLRFIYVIAIGEISRNILLTYLTYKSNYMPSFVFLMSLQLPIYILPIIPNYNWFLEGSFKLMLPFSIFILCSKFYEKKEGYRLNRRKRTMSLMPMIIIIIPMILLVSGVLKYQTMAVASNSMYPVFKRGDVLLYEKLTEDEKEKIKENDIIVFKKENSIIFHRVIEIRYSGLNTKHFITKGDNNNTIDNDYITSKDIVGIYKFSIPYLGYPSIWLQEFID